MDYEHATGQLSEWEHSIKMPYIGSHKILRELFF